MSEMSLAGRVAVVTGGGRGAGAAIAQALASAGAAVVVAARSRSEIEAVAARLTAAGARAWAFACDVADAGSVQRLVDSVRDHVGSVDVLVNNAGVALGAPLAKTSIDDWQRVMAVNATGTFLCTRAWLPGMSERGWGRVVNIASVAGLTGDRYVSAYTASKHAVIGFTRAVAAEAAGKGVTVNAVCPAYLDTEMTDATLAGITGATGRSRAEALEAIVARSPQKRLVTVDEVAAAVLYLCGDAARGVTGTSLVIDGGELRR
jgi:NAD(P)-dependent dehydrogenase (short-subunit alcohol dehydrogenase family)